MGKVGAQKCGVCQENVSKYRCPGCAVPYCSLACNKVHKAGTADKPPCSGKRARPEDNSTIQRIEPTSTGTSTDGKFPGKRPRAGGEDGGSMDASGVGGVGAGVEAVASCVRKPRDQWRGGKLEENIEEEWAMSVDQRARISKCEWLKAALRDPKLQGLLTEIDKAEDREKALAFHRTNPQFGEFMDKLLLEIEEYRKGGADEPELVAAEP